MFDVEAALTEVLSELGYRRRKKNVCRAEWSTADVEHFLRFQRWGIPKKLSCDFGIRNQRAQLFSSEEIIKYGGPIFGQMIRHDKRNGCWMNFPLGKHVDWNFRWALELETLSESEFKNRIRLAIEGWLLPFITQVVNRADLLELLLTDVEPCPWFNNNGAIRAAQIVCLARQIGWNPDDIRSALEPFARKIAVGFSKEGDPTHYVEDLIRDSDGSVLARAP